MNTYEEAARATTWANLEQATRAESDGLKLYHIVRDALIYQGQEPEQSAVLGTALHVYLDAVKAATLARLQCEENPPKGEP